MTKKTPQRTKKTNDFPIRNYNIYPPKGYKKTIKEDPIYDPVPINEEKITLNSSYKSKMDLNNNFKIKNDYNYPLKDLDLDNYYKLKDSYKNLDLKTKKFKSDSYSNLEKILDKYFNKNNPFYIPNNFSKINVNSKGINLKLNQDVQITAQNLGEFALPIVEYIHETQPDFVVPSDRGARLLGLAVYRLYKKLYGEFPTANGALNFRRFSTSNSNSETQKHLRPLIEKMLQYTKNPNVLVLDDWVVSGQTKNLAKEVFGNLSKGKIKTKFGVLIGNGADVSGHTTQTSGFDQTTDWRDNSNIIGVRYSRTKPTPVNSMQSKEYRKTMYKNIDELAKRILEKEIEKEPVGVN